MRTIFSFFRKKQSTEQSVDGFYRHLVVGKNSVEFIRKCFDSSILSNTKNSPILPMSHIKTEYRNDDCYLVINFFLYISNDFQNISSSGVLRGKNFLILSVDENDFESLKKFDEYFNFIKRMSSPFTHIVLVVSCDNLLNLQSEFIKQAHQFAKNVNIECYDVDRTTYEGLNNMFLYMYQQLLNEPQNLQL